MNPYPNVFLLSALLTTVVVAGESRVAPDGWRTAAPRDELRPRFAYTPKGGRDGKGAFVITHDRREGLDGYWTRTFAVPGSRS